MVGTLQIYIYKHIQNSETLEEEKKESTTKKEGIAATTQQLAKTKKKTEQEECVRERHTWTRDFLRRLLLLRFLLL